MAKIEIGIVGLPNVGKSILFNILTKQSVTSANYPFATIDPNVGIVPVPDERLSKLTEISGSKETIPTVVEFYDIAGLVRGANKGEGLGNKFLAHIRETHAIVHLVRCFENDNIIHVDGGIDPIRDIDTIEHELILKDLETVEKHIGNVEGKAKTGDKEAKLELEILQRTKAILEEERLISSSDLVEDEKSKNTLKHLQLLTDKPQLFLFNGNEEDVSDDLKEKVNKMGFEYIVVDLQNVQEVPELIKASYKTLDLITFLTTGEKESRAWTVEKGATAPKAAGVIHTDFEKNFIRVEVVPYEKLIDAGSWNKAKERGDMMLKGKDYVMQDGDVVYFRIGK